MKPNVQRLLELAVVLSLSLSSSWPARADEMTGLLQQGPLVRLETTSDGRFKQALAIADVDAPIDGVWAVLTDFPAYKTFMPRIERLHARRDGADWLVEFKLDTPLVSTSYTNRYTLDEPRRTIEVRQAKGDLEGSHFQWRLVPLSPTKTRIYYSGVVKNFSSLAERLDDEQQTITIGINVVSLMGAIKAVKARAEALARQGLFQAPPPSIREPSGG